MNNNADMPKKITADEIKVEVVDKDTGITYVRKLPINYLETSNFLRLSAEQKQNRHPQKPGRVLM